jgi:hypothetical protein
VNLIRPASQGDQRNPWLNLRLQRSRFGISGVKDQSTKSPRTLLKTSSNFSAVTFPTE